MSKAMLIFDIPKNCAECDLCISQDNEYYCIPDKNNHYLNASVLSHNATERPDWCPLRTVPQEHEYGGFDDKECGYEEGWNACLDEILNND